MFTMDDIQILYEDSHVLVVVKPQNIPSQEDETKDADMLTLLKGYIKEKYNKAGNVYLGLVHRLDRPTGGLMVFAKNSKSASRLSKAIVDGEMEKKYLAVLAGTLNEKKGILINFLKKHPTTNTVVIVTSATEGAKRAELEYEVLSVVANQLSLVRILLTTGRSHQIRVQFAGKNAPVFGDVKYGGDKLAKGHNLALWAYQLTFIHPTTKERMVFVAYPPEEKEPWKKFNIAPFIETFNDKTVSEVK